MPRTFADDMRDDVGRVFLNTEHFAESFIHTNPSIGADPQNVIGILDEEAPIAGTSSDEGDRNYRVGILSIPATVAVSVTPQKASRFQRGGETWVAAGLSFEGDLQLVRVKCGTLTNGRMGVWSGSQPR